MRLSDRLEKILALSGKCTCLADIGTDHGFIPIEAVRRGIADRALACDVRKGPLERADQHVREAGLSEKVDCRLGDGLMPVKEREADSVVITGMGGMLMCRLLSEGQHVLLSDGAAYVKQLILSPHSDIPEVRRAVAALNYGIADEDIVREEGKYYFYLSCVPSAKVSYSDREYEFGPVLLKKRPELWLEYLKEKTERNESVLKKLDAAPDTEENRKTKEKIHEENVRIEQILHA